MEVWPSKGEPRGGGEGSLSAGTDRVVMKYLGIF